jgi:predicted TPR repeat methyltransferase
MLARARERHAYDELVKGELTEYLQGGKDAFDLIVSVDTLVYFGSLEDVISSAADALRPGGLLIFTLEEATDVERTVGFCIGHHGRYSHTRTFIEHVLVNANLRPEIVRAELRMEWGVPVAGFVVRATRPVNGG